MGIRTSGYRHVLMQINGMCVSNNYGVPHYPTWKPRAPKFTWYQLVTDGRRECRQYLRRTIHTH